MSDSTFPLRRDQLQPGLRGEFVRFRRPVSRQPDAYLRAGVPGAYLPRLRLEVPHRMQEHVSHSVPACVAMILEYHGVRMEPDRLASILETDDLSGTPGRRLGALRHWGVHLHTPRALQVYRDGTLELNQRVASETGRVVYKWEEPWLRYVQAALEQGLPPLLFVDLGRLGLVWRGFSQPHAVVLAGGDGRQAWIHDPSRAYGPVRVGLGTLMDSLLPGEPLAALLRPDSLVRSLEATEAEGGE